MKNKIAAIIVCSIALASILFVKYGIDTWCPNTAVYVYCGKQK